MTEAQQAVWREAVDNAPHGVLKAADAGLLAVWVVAADQHRTATIQQSKLDAGNSLPLLTKDRAGTAAASLYLSIQNRAATIMLKSGSELGFSPSTRPRMTGSPARKERTPWDEIDEPLEALPAVRANWSAGTTARSSSGGRGYLLGGTGRDDPTGQPDPGGQVDGRDWGLCPGTLAGAGGAGGWAE